MEPRPYTKYFTRESRSNFNTVDNSDSVGTLVLFRLENILYELSIHGIGVSVLPGYHVPLSLLI